jgi:hypothetical protein
MLTADETHMEAPVLRPCGVSWSASRTSAYRAVDCFHLVVKARCGLLAACVTAVATKHLLGHLQQILFRDCRLTGTAS